MFFLCNRDGVTRMQGWAILKSNARIKDLQHGSGLWEGRKIR
jgi:hypothetical protein